MSQSETSSELENGEQTNVPWVGFFSKPYMNFRRPKVVLPHKAPHQYIAGMLFVVCVFLLAGGVYDLAESPIPLGYTKTGYTPIYPSLNDQFLIESVTTMIFIGVGAVGFFLIKFPTSQGRETNTRSASFILSIASVLIILGLFAAYSMFQMKIYGSL